MTLNTLRDTYILNISCGSMSFRIVRIYIKKKKFSQQPSENSIEEYQFWLEYIKSI